jgi:hypothetical protein
VQNDNWNLDTAERIKVIKVLVYEESNKLSLVDYLSSISDLIFTTRASEMRYGETYYFRGTGKNIKVTIVPTIALSVLPRKYRKQQLFYVLVLCHPEDMRFDTFHGYRTISATQYDV